MPDFIPGQFVKVAGLGAMKMFAPRMDVLSYARFVGWFQGQAVVEDANQARYFVAPDEIFPLDQQETAT